MKKVNEIYIFSYKKTIKFKEKIKRASHKIEMRINLEEIEKKNANSLQNENITLVTPLLGNDIEIQSLKKSKKIIKTACFISGLLIMVLTIFLVVLLINKNE